MTPYRERLESGEYQAGQQSEPVDATPAAVKKAEELGVDLEDIEGSGKGGRVLASDVQEADQN